METVATELYACTSGRQNKCLIFVEQRGKFHYRVVGNSERSPYALDVLAHNNLCFRYIVVEQTDHKFLSEQQIFDDTRDSVAK